MNAKKKPTPQPKTDRADAWRKVVENATESAKRDPQRYLEDTKVPTGGE